MFVLIAWGLQALIGGYFGPIFAFLPFLLAAMTTAWLGGIRPTLVALAFGYVIAVFFYVQPQTLLVSGGDKLVSLGIYLFLGLSSGVLHEALQRERRGADAISERLHATLASLAEGVVAADAGGRITTLNPVAEELTGWAAAEAIGQNYRSVLHWVDERSGQAMGDPAEVALRMNDSRPLPEHCLLVNRSGKRQPVRGAVAPMRNADGEPSGVAIVFRDAGTERASEEAVRGSEERLRLALSAGNMGVWDWNLVTGELTWSERVYAIHGLDAHSFTNRADDFRRLVYSEDVERVNEAIRRALEEHAAYDCEFRIRRPDAEIRWIYTSGRVLRDPADRPLRMLGATIDITERKEGERTQEFLAAASETLWALEDYTVTMRHVARCAVPHFADSCSMYLISDEGQIETVAQERADAPADGDTAPAQELPAANVTDWNTSSPVTRVLRSGQLEYMAEVPELLLRDAAQAAEDFGGCLPRSYVCVPLSSRNRTIGCLLFSTHAAGRTYRQRDVNVAVEVARRASTSIDNALLWRKLQEASRQKDDFLAMLAHELRNPLAALQYANEVAKTPGLLTPAEVSEIVDRQLKTLTHLIDDLLDVSRINRNKIQLRFERVDGAALARRAVGTCRPRIDQRRHTLHCSVPDEDLPLLVDPTRVEQILVNLLSNAAKYTPEGGTIWLSAVREGKEAVFRVRDTGIGIQQEMLPHVFELFMQVGQSLDHSQGGLGIGLTVVRKLVELHGGVVSVASEGLGQGSEFTVRLSLADPALNALELKANRAAAARPMRVLVVDDNRDIARSLSLMLRALGHDVCVAHDGPAALEIVHTARPEAFVLDIGLPGMDGYELARRLRAAGYSREPFIAITGYGQPEDRQRSHAAGFNHHLVKPVKRERLLELLVAGETE